MDKFVIRSDASGKNDTNKMSDGEDAPENPMNPPASSSGSAKRIIHLTCVSRKKSKVAPRKWNDDYITYGFYLTKEEKLMEYPKPTCLICGNYSLANASMVPNKLMRHLRTTHPDLQNKPRVYFERLRQSNMQLSDSMESRYSGSSSKPLVTSSLKIAHLLALKKKPFDDAEQLIIPAVKIICEEIGLQGKPVMEKIDNVAFSRMTMERRTILLADDLLEQSISKIANSPWIGIQFDESVDVTNRAQLLCYVRYVDADHIVEDFLFCEDLGIETTGKAIADTVINFFDTHDLDLGRCSSVTTDGAAAMTGVRNGAVALLKQNAPHLEGTHCDIHRQNLATKKGGLLDEVVNDCTSIINFIKSKAKNSRMFTELCSQMDAEHASLLFHCEIRWLSIGIALSRLFTLRKGVFSFLSKHACPKAALFCNDLWRAKLGYLCDILAKINQLNLSLQGVGQDIFSTQDKIKAFIRKIRVWIARVEQNNISDFESFTEAVKESQDENTDSKAIPVICQHLRQLESNFKHYFPSSEASDNSKNWIVNPFLSTVSTSGLSNHDAELLIELSCDSEMKLKFHSLDRCDFWVHVFHDTHYHSLGEKAVKKLVAFHSTYQSERGFSDFVIIKNKKRNRLSNDSLKSLLRNALTKNVQPRFERIANLIQQQKSH